MAAAAVQGVQLNKILQCSICIDVFTDPRTLPCLHTFCCKCIADWCKDTQPGDKVTCPECREEFVIPDSGIDGLKKNFFVANMLCTDEVDQKTGDLCEICVGDRKNVSEMFCLHCGQSYCESCSESHIKIITCSSHKLVRLNELQSGVDVKKKYRPQYCDEHSEELIKMYCLDDEVAICLMCCVLDHRSHRCEEVKNIANQFRSEKWKQDLQTELNEVEEKLRVLILKKVTFFDKIKIVENEICDQADKKIQLIMNHKQKLVSLLQNIKTQHEGEIDEVNQELTLAKALLSSFKDYCEKIGSDVDICRERNSLCRKYEELLKLEHLEDSFGKIVDPSVIFSSSSLTFEDTKSTLGELKAVKSGVFNESEDEMMLEGTSTVTDECGVFSESKHKSMLPVTTTVIDNLPLLSTLCQPPTHNNYLHSKVTGVAMLDRYICVVYNKYDKVYVFSCKDHLKKIKNIQVNELSCPWDMVGCSVTSQLFISDCSNGNILRVNVNTGVSDVFIELDHKLATLSLAENRLLVTSRNWQSMYDINSGRRMKNIPLPEDMKEYGIFHAIESNRNSFFASIPWLKTVSEIDTEGVMFRVFDNKEQINCGHLALDSVGRLVVVDWNNYSVVLLDERLKFIKFLLDKEQLDDARPRRLSYNKNNNRLAVGLGNGHVKIFDCHV